jgi:hypothetical protein
MQTAQPAVGVYLIYLSPGRPEQPPEAPRRNLMTPTASVTTDSADRTTSQRPFVTLRPSRRRVTVRPHRPHIGKRLNGQRSTTVCEVSTRPVPCTATGDSPLAVNIAAHAFLARRGGQKRTTLAAARAPPFLRIPEQT